MDSVGTFWKSLPVDIYKNVMKSGHVLVNRTDTSFLTSVIADIWEAHIRIY